jgi:glycerol-3-phosphate O-acyltransferase
MFPEGGLSLDGGLQPLKLGLLKYIVEERSPGGRDVVFVPVAINYDRVFEDRMLVAAGKAGGRRFPARISVILRFIMGQIWLRLRGRYHRHGYAAVSFGAPLSLREFQRSEPMSEVRGLARALSARIGAVVPVLPVPLVARAMTEAGGALDREALEARVAAMIAALPEAHIHLPRDDLGYAARFGLQVLRKRGMVQADGGQIRVVAGQEDMVAYYARSIAHLFAGAARTD